MSVRLIDGLTGAVQRVEVESKNLFYLHEVSVKDPNVRRLKQILIRWINTYMREDKIYIRDLADDLADGQLLMSLLQKLAKDDFNFTPTNTAEKNRATNLKVVARILRDRYNILMEDGLIEGILEKDFVSVVRLLVEIAHKFDCPYQLPSNVEVVLVHRIRHIDGTVSEKTSRHLVTADESAWGNIERDPPDPFDVDEIDERNDKHEPDVFDDLELPGYEDKLQVVEQMLLTFVNQHLAAFNIVVSDIAHQFHDGVYLLMLIGVVGGFYVPTYNYSIAPASIAEKIANVKLAFRLMRSLEVPRNAWNAEAIVHKRTIVTLRVIFALYNAFKDA